MNRFKRATRWLNLILGLLMLASPDAECEFEDVAGLRLDVELPPVATTDGARLEDRAVAPIHAPSRQRIVQWTHRSPRLGMAVWDGETNELTADAKLGAPSAISALGISWHRSVASSCQSEVRGTHAINDLAGELWRFPLRC